MHQPLKTFSESVILAEPRFTANQQTVENIMIDQLS